MAGSRVQQTCSRRAEETVEVVRDHEDGTGVVGWYRRPDGSSSELPGVDARMVEQQRGNKREMPREEELTTAASAEVARGSSQVRSTLKERRKATAVNIPQLRRREGDALGKTSKTPTGNGGRSRRGRGRPTTRYRARSRTRPRTQKY
jgi:hypothetical protein